MRNIWGIDKHEIYSKIYKSVEGCHHKAINTYIDLFSFHTYLVTKWVIKSYESSHHIFSLKILHSYFEVYKCASYKFVYNKLDMIVNKIKGKNILHTQYYNTASAIAKLIEPSNWG